MSHILRFMTPLFSKLNFPSFDKIFETGKFEEKSHIVHWSEMIIKGLSNHPTQQKLAMSAVFCWGKKNLRGMYVSNVHHCTTQYTNQDSGYGYTVQ